MVRREKETQTRAIITFSFLKIFIFLVALTQLSKLVPNLTLIATASAHKFDVLRAHIHYLFEHDIDYTEDVKKYCFVFFECVNFFEVFSFAKNCT